MMYDYKRLMMERNKCCRGSLLANKCVLCSFVEEVRGKLYYCTKICFTLFDPLCQQWTSVTAKILLSIAPSSGQLSY